LAEVCGADPTGAGELLTVTDLAVRWRVSKMTIYRLIRSGRAPAVRVGQSYLIPASFASNRDQRSRPHE
jgi:excisionase family DNA binding protein